MSELKKNPAIVEANKRAIRSHLSHGGVFPVDLFFVSKAEFMAFLFSIFGKNTLFGLESEYFFE
jgi:hypothetical protein